MAVGLWKRCGANLLSSTSQAVSRVAQCAGCCRCHGVGGPHWLSVKGVCAPLVLVAGAGAGGWWLVLVLVLVLVPVPVLLT